MSRIRKKESSGAGAPWLTTYSDLMSLLLTFFILLFSMSSVDTEKFANVTSSLQEAFIGIQGADSIIDGYEGSEVVPIQEGNIIDDGTIGIQISPEIIQMFEKVGEFITENDLNAEVDVRYDDEGVFVDIKDAILFDTGSAQLKDSGINVLNMLEGLINDFENDIVVEGHTDNVPINVRQYPTNWELSTARAVSVVRYLSEVEDIDPGRLSARGYGEHSPIAPNDTPQNRALNRRVNLFIVFDNKGGE
ncbi:flagellar motor protein MotB [Tissierella sp. Yu-01]|uniref:flagellar motor protein MotB n=1 Tax=Tissierella sp. Yu-01 TaxID=3035694 RepID=UPI00240E764E|nr:flagellar motor protein MotB [Tissierella sp. Yu-01]WFA07890.1 flagellar motor protein MotB [Tissierella sp. Yu-01]